ncbi:MAG: DUF3618 domain-containing protein [Actinobacteria bacterium]|nr:DUF3618 domain-containing protein [Actinomycetota bacterium]
MGATTEGLTTTTPAQEDRDTKSPDEIRHGIAAKRKQLTDDLTALGEHVAPRHMAKRRLERLARLIGGGSASDHTDEHQPDHTRVPVVAAACFAIGLVLGLWVSRRRHRPALVRATKLDEPQR